MLNLNENKFVGSGEATGELAAENTIKLTKSAKRLTKTSAAGTGYWSLRTDFRNLSTPYEQGFTLKPGVLYTMGAWIYAPSSFGPTNASLRAEFDSSNITTGINLSIAEQWQLVLMNVTPPSPANMTLRVSIDGFASSYIIIDGLSVAEDPPILDDSINVNDQFTVTPKFCIYDVDCSIANAGCLCQANSCKPCQAGYACTAVSGNTNNCVEQKSIEIAVPDEINGTVAIEAKINGTLQAGSPVKYAVHKTSTVCDGSSWTTMSTIGSTTYRASLTTTNFADEKYYICVNATYADGTKITEKKQATINNYRFSFNPLSTTGNVKTGMSIDYPATIMNDGLSDEFSISYAAATGWSASLMINNQSRNSLLLAKGESANITVKVTAPLMAAIGSEGNVNVIIRSVKTNETTTTTLKTAISDLSNHPPTIAIMPSRPDPVMRGSLITFYAGIKDIDNDTMDAKACKNQNCTEEYCIMSYTDKYDCNYNIDLSEGIYYYYIRATDAVGLQSTGTRQQFNVIEPECLVSTDCAGIETSCYCQENKCRECPVGYGCSANNKCEREAITPEPQPECVKNTDCSDGKICQDQKCILSLANECTKSSDCPSGECRYGKCVSGAGGSSSGLMNLVLIIIAVTAVPIIIFTYILKTREGKEEW